MPEPPVALPEPPPFPTVETGREFLEYHDGVAEREAIAERLLEPYLRSEAGLERVAEAVLHAERRSIRPPVITTMRDLRARHLEAAVAWESEVLEHFEHPTFGMFDDLWQRRFGFTCGCTEGPVQQRPISMAALGYLSQGVRALIASLPRVALEPPRRLLDALDRAHRFASRPVQKKERRGYMRSRALLHQMLTREQRWSLRASGSFIVRGQDDRVYEIDHHGSVQLIIDGKPKVTYCIHPKERLPVFDVMLAQKLLLESNVEHFLATANARFVAA